MLPPDQTLGGLAPGCTRPSHALTGCPPPERGGGAAAAAATIGVDSFSSPFVVVAAIEVPPSSLARLRLRRVRRRSHQRARAARTRPATPPTIPPTRALVETELPPPLGVTEGEAEADGADEKEMEEDSALLVLVRKVLNRQSRCQYSPYTPTGGGRSGLNGRLTSNR